MERSLSFRIALVIIGLFALTFGVFTGFSHGWQLDVINTITIAAAIVLILIGVFVKGSGSKNKSIKSYQL